jgi:hypothetical protein
MGNEAACTLKIGKRKSIGKALLETSEILFRPGDGSPRVKIPFAAMKSVKAMDGELCVETSDGTMTFELGPAATKWREKILHPKSRAEKLGVKSGMNVSLLGEFDGDFLKELRAATKMITTRKVDAKSEIIFLAVNLAKDLPSAFAETAKVITGATALWIVYPKGNKEITENDVLTGGRKVGLKDVKVVGFSPTHTALKFVLPVAKR